LIAINEIGGKLIAAAYAVSFDNCLIIKDLIANPMKILLLRLRGVDNSARPILRL
jgi:hypothetical protein